MKKRWLWVIPALAGIAVIGSLWYWGNNNSVERKQMLTYLNNRNQRSFYELVGNVQNMETMLSKGIVSNSPTQRMILFSDIWQKAYAAQEDLTQVPISQASLTRTSKFLTQTAEFSWSLAKKYARGEQVENGELNKLNDLHKQAGFLSAELLKIEKQASDGRLSWSEIRNSANQKLKQQSLSAGMENVDKSMEEFPTLIYDGPFSDHITKRKPMGLTGATINRTRAESIAKNIVRAATGDNYKVVKVDSVNGNIPAFRVQLTPQSKQTPVVIVDVTKKGGHILSVINTRRVNTPAMKSDKSLDIARKYLEDNGYKNMMPTYVIEQQNTAVAIFEYVQDNVLIYPDLMKVKVALDNGEVVGYEGTQFIVNHHERKLAKPKVSMEKAQKAVNPDLKITGKRLTIIPQENLQEVQAYEFQGNLNGDDFIVYINAETGKEENILRVIQTNGGPVTL